MNCVVKIITKEYFPFEMEWRVEVDVKHMIPSSMVLRFQSLIVHR